VAAGGNELKATKGTKQTEKGERWRQKYVGQKHRGLMITDYC